MMKILGMAYSGVCIVVTAGCFLVASTFNLFRGQ
jgi:hypothetical protein